MPCLSFYLSLGSNLGKREANLDEALARLRGEGLDIQRVSSVYETEPVGAAAGPQWFLNLAAGGASDCEAAELLARCLAVERSMGRERTTPGGPRRIDVDLLLMGTQVVSGPECVLPHPRMHLRRFVLEPLAEIAPDAAHPVLGLAIKDILVRLQDPARALRRGRPGLPLPRSRRAQPGRA